MALRNQPYIPLYVQDFLTDEKLNECSAESTGVYIKIMCLMHKSEPYGTILLKQKDKQTSEQITNFALKLLKHLPFTLPEITRSLVELIAEKCLIIDEDCLSQKRMIKDNDISEKRSNAGKNGGLSTQNKVKTKDKKFAKAKTKANSETEYEIESDIEDVTFIKKNEKIDFDVFWIEYDKKQGDRIKLKKVWDKFTYETQNLILDYIPGYKQATPDKQFRKMPSTFFNNRSWLDEIIMPAKVVSIEKQTTFVKLVKTGNSVQYNGRK